jgi:hypothetical protein
VGNWLKSVWEGLSRSRDPDTGKFATPDGWDWNKLLEEMGKTQQEVLNLAAHGGSIIIKDIVPQDEDNEEVYNKVYEDVNGQTALESCTTSTLNITLSIVSTFPMCKIGNTIIELDESADEGHYSKDVNYTLAVNDTSITVSMLLPNDTLGTGYTVELEIVAGPTLLTLHFTGGYPGSQTELKAGDTFQITGTTDVPCVAARIEDFGACDAKIQTFPSTNSFVITGVIANRGNSVQSLAAKVQARDSDGAYGAKVLTNIGGTTDGYHLVKCNNIAPSFIDNGFSNTSNPGATAFKGTEVGDQDTEIANYNTVAYTSPHGDFSITSPATYDQAKGITCTNPGDYNDSVTNFRIIATRTANDASTTFNKTIEVSDTAPTLTVTQVPARMQSETTHVITVTSDQNLSGAPDLNIVVGGTWQGGGFAGSGKIWTRTLLVEHSDSRGTAAWTQVTPATSNSGINAGITGNCVIGGFTEIIVTFDHNPAWNLEPISTLAAVSDTSKLLCEDNAGNALTYQAGTGDGLLKYTIADAGGNPDPNGNYIRWCDLDAVGANTTGTAYLKIQETV